MRVPRQSAYTFFNLAQSVYLSCRTLDRLVELAVSWHIATGATLDFWPLMRREMKTSVSELNATLQNPSCETIQDLRLWKAFIKLSPSKRAEVLALVEQLGADPVGDVGGDKH